jgi:putative transposase
LLVEAENTVALSRGMQGLGIRLAKAVNRVLARHGAVWGDRYHARDLRTPSEVRNGLAYVLLNARKHGIVLRGADPCSTAAWFGGWRETIDRPPDPCPVVRARTWLLCVGWRRSGSISISATPVAKRVAVPRRIQRRDNARPVCLH